MTTQSQCSKSTAKAHVPTFHMKCPALSKDRCKLTMHETMSRGRGGRSVSGGRRTGHGGRGRSGGRSRNNDSSQRGAQRTKLLDHTCNVGSTKQASDFVVVNECLIDHIRKTCDHGGDMGSALEEMNHFDFQPCKPTLTASTETNAAKKKVEDRQFELE